MRSEHVFQLKRFFDQSGEVKVSNSRGVQEPFMKILSEFISDDVLSNLLIEAYMHEIICGVYRISAGATTEATFSAAATTPTKSWFTT